MARKPKVVITDYDYGNLDIELPILEAAGARVVALQAKSEEELFEEARDCDAIMNQYARVGSATIDRMERCRVIARYGVGVDIVDVEAATRKGILVTNVRDYCTDEVADHAIALWLALARKLIRYDAAIRNGIWRWQTGKPVCRLKGRTMGIVSFGKIGQAIAERAKAFGVTIIAYDPYLAEGIAEAKGVALVGKDEILARSDYLMMQVPMTAESHHFLGEAELAKMRKDAIIVNTGRGPTIDNCALAKALAEGRIAGAGLDDLEEEPAKLRNWNPSSNPLFSLENLIVTSHVAYYSEESIRLARETAASEVARVLKGERPLNPVNEVSLGGQDGDLRRN
ncbi:C-terminal binding protein [Sinorhizobium garamanticum]|uniref:C-terminal binding protein n=1 Tax=Sinorhizobium garamanticum TaxID=680247 RepID=A0ABY8DGM4_9HYPH|nr:C-terminal binding protein [Sinorhizobium garamanticum]WEX90039.1 C-terminal binding protein [Sinorhizobium garamanticum]